MEGVDLSGCIELTSLYNSLLSDIKSGSSLWEDVVNKGGKLYAALRTTVYASTAFLDSIQCLADLASRTKGGSKEIGASLTRLCMRQKRLGAKVKTMSTQLITCMTKPLSTRLDDWKRSVSQIEKQHSHDSKRARADLKRAMAEVNRLQRKLAKQGNAGRWGSNASPGIGAGVGLGEPPVSARTLSSRSSTLGFQGLGSNSLTVQVECAAREMEEKLRRVDDVERTSIRRLMLEERGRYCLLFDCLKPALESESSMLGEISTLRDLLNTLTIATHDPAQLLDDAESILARAGSRTCCGKLQQQTATRSGSGLPSVAAVLADSSNAVDAFAAAAATIVLNRQQKQQHIEKPDRADIGAGEFGDSLTSGHSSQSSGGLTPFVPINTSSVQQLRPTHSSISDRASLSTYSGSISSSGCGAVSSSSGLAQNGFALHTHESRSNQISLNSSISSANASNAAAHQMALILRQPRSHDPTSRSASVGRIVSFNPDTSGNDVMLRRTSAATSPHTNDWANSTLVSHSHLMNGGGGGGSVDSTPHRQPSVDMRASNISSDSVATTSLQRNSTTTLQMQTSATRVDEDVEGEAEEEEEEEEEEEIDGNFAADSDGNLIDPPVKEKSCVVASTRLSELGPLPTGRHTISSVYEQRGISGARRTPLSSVYFEPTPISRNSESNAILYPNQALPPPVYNNLNELTHAAQRKFFMTANANIGTSHTKSLDLGVQKGVSVSETVVCTVAASSRPPVEPRHLHPMSATACCDGARSSFFNRNSEDTVSIASAPTRPLSNISSSHYGVFNSTVGVFPPARGAAPLYSAPGSPQNHVNNATLLDRPPGQLSEPMKDLQHNRPYCRDSANRNLLVELSAKLHTSSLDDPFSLEMDELDRMVAGSSGTSSTNAISSNLHLQALQVECPSASPTSHRVSTNSSRPLSQISTTGLINCSTGIPVGLQVISHSRPLVGEIRNSSFSHISSRTTENCDRPPSPKVNLSTQNHSLVDVLSSTSSQPSPLFVGPPSSSSSGYARLDRVTPPCQCASLTSSQRPSTDDEDIDVRAMNVAGTAASLLSQLSGQLQQLTTANGMASFPSSTVVQDVEDADFDLPEPPSPGTLDAVDC